MDALGLFERGPAWTQTKLGHLPAPQALGIAFCDNLIHGWDLARSTGQDATMPTDLAEAAFAMLSGNIPDDRRTSALFKPAVRVPDDASARDKLLANAGREPR